MTLFGDRRGGGRSSSPSSKISYASYYEREKRPQKDLRVRAAYDYDDLILDSRGEAEEILARLEEMISVYGTARVADFYELAGVTGSYTNNNYGWTDLHNAGVMRVRDGYVIRFPRALPLT